MEKRKKRKKKNKLWILQAVLCAVCMFSAALLYYDYVTVPRQNRELVEELKTCFPEDIPPGSIVSFLPFQQGQQQSADQIRRVCHD